MSLYVLLKFSIFYEIKTFLFSRDGTKQYRDGEAMSPVWIVYLIAQIAEQTDKVRVLQAEGDKARVLSFIMSFKILIVPLTS